MKLSVQQKAILYGTLLGDGYLQKVGRQSARLRLEHSKKQFEYIVWKYEQLKNLFKRPPTFLKRIHPLSGKEYRYWRLQSHSGPVLGRLRADFYQDGLKCIPKRLDRYLRSNLTLAVWYMDDGFYYQRDRMAFIYLPRYAQNDLERLVRRLKERFALEAVWHCSNQKRSCHLSFPVKETEKLARLIGPYIIPSLRYKVPSTP